MDWQPIETAPKDGTKLKLGFTCPVTGNVEDGGALSYWYDSGRSHWTGDYGPSFWAGNPPLPFEPTHWAPRETPTAL